MSPKFSKAASVTLRIVIIVLALAGVALLEVAWLYPQQMAVRYTAGKHVFWELQVEKHRATLWECLLLFLKEEPNGSSYTVSPHGQGWSFSRDYADCSAHFHVHPFDAKIPPPDEAMVKRVAARLENLGRQLSLTTEIKPYEDGYEMICYFKLTDRDYLQALKKESDHDD